MESTALADAVHCVLGWSAPLLGETSWSIQKCSAVRWLMKSTSCADGEHCDGRCSALRFSLLHSRTDVSEYSLHGLSGIRCSSNSPSTSLLIPLFAPRLRSICPIAAPFIRERMPLPSPFLSLSSRHVSVLFAQSISLPFLEAVPCAGLGCACAAVGIGAVCEAETC